MTNAFRLPPWLMILALSLALTACAPEGEAELRQWMAEQRANTRSGVPPLSEPKNFIPEQYSQSGALEPFNPQKLVQGMESDATHTTVNTTLLTPEQERRKEPLESFALDTMAMVGSIDKAGAPTALLRVDNLIYQVRIGNYLGQNYGKIVKITETSVQLREIAQDASGDWVERMVSLDLQEVKK